MFFLQVYNDNLYDLLDGSRQVWKMIEGHHPSG